MGVCLIPFTVYYFMIRTPPPPLSSLPQNVKAVHLPFFITTQLMRRILNRGFGGLGLAVAFSAPVSTATPYTATPVSPATTSVRFFDLKKYKLEKKRRRDAELRGENPDEEEDEDALPWANEEEQKRMSEEEEARKNELEELTKKMMEERDAEAKLKRQNFKKWRAEQKAKSADAKAALVQAKSEKNTAQVGRSQEETVDESTEEDLIKSGAFDDADDIAPANDVAEKRSDIHRIHSVQKKLVGDE